jgi:hypothetical protein
MVIGADTLDHYRPRLASPFVEHAVPRERQTEADMAQMPYAEGVEPYPAPSPLPYQQELPPDADDLWSSADHPPVPGYGLVDQELNHL